MKNTKPQSIDEYIEMFSSDIATILEKIRQLIKKAAPDATEAISYQMPTFKLKGKNLVHFAAFKNHIGFYPTPSGTENFKSKLSQYKTSKGTAQFQLNEPIPYGLITEIVKFRVKEEKNSKNKGY